MNERKEKIYKFIMVINNKSYFYTGTIQEEDEQWLLISDRKIGLTKLNKKFLATRYEANR